MSNLLEVYRNSVQAWECDDLGHMNVQFYVDKAAAGLNILGHHLGLGPGALAAQGLKLVTGQHHIRFHREQIAGAPICILAGVLHTTGDELQVYLEMRNPESGAVAATFVAWATLRALDDGSLRPLPADARRAAESFRTELPDYGAARGLELHPPRQAPTLAEAESLGMRQIYLGLVQPAMCDQDGVLADRCVIGAISDGFANLLPYGHEPDAPSRNLGGAALEYRLVYHRRLRPGDILCVRSGIRHVGTKPYSLGNWLFDYATGEAVATAESVAITLDLEARRAVPVPDGLRRQLEQRLIPGLSV